VPWRAILLCWASPPPPLAAFLVASAVDIAPAACAAASVSRRATAPAAAAPALLFSRGARGEGGSLKTQTCPKISCSSSGANVSSTAGAR
jgi:hypothetical protein